jgi:hypothetical protein
VPVLICRRGREVGGGRGGVRLPERGCKPDYAALAPTVIEHARKSHRARARTDPKSGRADAGTVLRALAVLVTPPLVKVSRGRE